MDSLHTVLTVNPRTRRYYGSGYFQSISTYTYDWLHRTWDLWGNDFWQLRSKRSLLPLIPCTCQTLGGVVHMCTVPTQESKEERWREVGWEKGIGYV